MEAEHSEEKEASFSIYDQNKVEVLRIEKDGGIFWMKDGELVKAQTDEDLGKAFSLTILEISGMNYKRMLDVYLGESVRFLKSRIVKEVMGKSEKSKSIKKKDFLKIIEEVRL